MKNPWIDIPLEIYESHMSLSDVAQLQALNNIMREQVMAYQIAESVAVLGVAGGNGLEHCLERFKLVYGIDINPAYLAMCAKRFRWAVDKSLRLIETDLSKPESVILQADLIIANLLIEYVGIETFCKKAAMAQAQYVSCVIQGTDCEQSFVSESPYQSAFHGIGKLHQDVDEMKLTDEMVLYHYIPVYRGSYDMPNSKSLVRLDYSLDGRR